ncbi:hypothetical protein [Flavobacterium sp.]|uniref:hypothetical protein n=1 Tax=Flavobacterium sp. TaxID=239 RepID=UPI00374CFAAF
MKTIIYILGITILLLTFSSCTADDMIENPKDPKNLQATGEIDPPIPMPKP